MSIILNAFKSEHGRYVQGTNFSKGDFIATIIKYWLRLDDHRTVEVDRGTVKDLIGGDPQRISGKMLDSLKGKTYNG